MTKQILLVGCGKMGGALVRAWQRDPAFAVTIVKRTPSDAYPCLSSPDFLPAGYAPDMVVLAVKPQQMPGVLPAYARFGRGPFLSIAAGLTLEKLATLAGGGDRAILRAMPNLPASVGAGASVIAANQQASQSDKDLAQQLLAAVGSVEWLPDETLIDAATALSGSGPAYAFALVEAMAAAGVKLGLEAELSARLARATLIGSGALLASVPETAEDLRKAVTSPGGTTAAALEHLLAEDGLGPLLERAMMAAAQRAKQLAS